MDPRTWHAAEWGAFGQVGALVVAVVAGILVWVQVQHAKNVREDQNRPYVIVDFEFVGLEVVFAIRNVGGSPAINVRINFDRPLEAPHIDDPDELAVFANGIPMLAPGRTMSIPFGAGPSFFPEDGAAAPPLRYSARLTYEDVAGRRKYDDPPLVLDLLPYKHTLIERDDLHQIYQNLKEIKNLMKSWTSERRLRINSITQVEVDAKHEAFLEARRQARQDTAAQD